MKIPINEEILKDTKVEDIVLSTRGSFIFSKQKWTSLENSAVSTENLRVFAQELANLSSLNLSLTQPVADACWSFDSQNSFRVHIAIPPLCPLGPEITLRRLPTPFRFSWRDYLSSREDRELVQKHLMARSSMLIVGATGSGKSSFLNALLEESGPQERVVILEDSPEIPVPNNVSTKLLTRNNRFGFRNGAQWELEDLLYESLRMRPDRIVLGECRGAEAAAIYQALMTGHKGIMSTLHAGSCEEALIRFNELAKPAVSTIRKLDPAPQSSKWDLILFLGASKKVQEIQESYGYQA